MGERGLGGRGKKVGRWSGVALAGWLEKGAACGLGFNEAFQTHGT